MNLYECLLKLNEFEVVNKYFIRGELCTNVKRKLQKHNFMNKDYIFLCLLYNNKGYVYLENIIYNEKIEGKLEHFDEETYDYEDYDAVLFGSEKKYCIEIMDEKSSKTKLNWVENKPTCDLPIIENTKCKGLFGIMNLIFSFLKSINFSSYLYLDDNSSINDIQTIVPRLLLGKKSIYSEFGFVPTKKSSEQIQELVLELSNIETDHDTIGKQVKQHINNNGSFRESMNNFKRELTSNEKTKHLYNDLVSSHLDMRANIAEVTPQCPLITVNKESKGGYYAKYILYKNKYLELKKKIKLD